MTPYIAKKFHDTFDRGCQFWTSEDGDACELVITRTDDIASHLTAFARLEREYDLLTAGRCAEDLKPAWVFREWVGLDFFDGRSGRRSGKTWRITDRPTEFPVWVFDPYRQLTPEETPHEMDTNSTDLHVRKSALHPAQEATG